MRIRVADAALKDRARSLRRSSTPAETALWQLLRNKSLGVRFRRQRPIGPYIVDFYCPEAGLVVEVDGAHHSLEDQKADDEVRTAYLTGCGLRLIRFQNEEVLRRGEQVLARIRSALTLTPDPSPGLGRGE